MKKVLNLFLKLFNLNKNCLLLLIIMMSFLNNYQFFFFFKKKREFIFLFINFEFYLKRVNC
jgi:hypothetical protein